MNLHTSDNKRYVEIDLKEGVSIFSDRYYGDYDISERVLRDLSKDIGVPYDIYKNIADLNVSLANDLIAQRSKRDKVLLILDDVLMEVVGYTFEVERQPILNSDFIYRTISLIGANAHVTASEIYYVETELISSVLIKKVDPIHILEEYENKDNVSVPYEVGILLINDETNTTYSRLVVYQEGQPIYLPANYYNATTTRFKRSTSDSIEALEVLLLKVIEDLRDEIISDRLYDFHFTYRANKTSLASYEEYNSLLRTLKKIPTIIDSEDDILSNLESTYYDFESKYSQMEDQKSSYIWRCTASTELTIGTLITITAKMLSELNAPADEYASIRDLLGNYMSTKRIAGEIARERRS